MNTYKGGESMKSVYLVLFHWGYDGDNGVEYYLFSNYSSAYDKFNELIQEEINNQWVCNYLTENRTPLEGYELDTIIQTEEDESDLWWNFYEIGRGSENFTNIDLKKVEVN